MDVWEILLYACGAFLALRTLVALMQQHRRYYLRKLAAEHQRELQQQAAQKQMGTKAKHSSNNEAPKQTAA